MPWSDLLISKYDWSSWWKYHLSLLI